MPNRMNFLFAEGLAETREGHSEVNKHQYLIFWLTTMSAFGLLGLGILWQIRRLTQAVINLAAKLPPQTTLKE